MAVTLCAAEPGLTFTSSIGDHCQVVGWIYEDADGSIGAVLIKGGTPVVWWNEDLEGGTWQRLTR